MLGPVADQPAPDALVGRVAVHLAHEGPASALASLVDGVGLRSALLRRADGELLATAGEVVQAVPLRRRAPGSTVELPVRGPGGPVVAHLTVTGARPQLRPLLNEIAAVLGLVLAAAAPPGGTATLADVEAERAALADALHDGPLQELVAARYAADTAVRTGADPELRVAVQGALVALRRVVWQLRPRGSDGLADALSRLSAQLIDRGQPPLHLRIDPAADVLPEPAGVAAYRLVQAVAASPAATLRGPVTVRLVRQNAPGGRQVLALSVDGGAPLRDPARWRRTAAALGGDLLCCPSRLRLALPVPLTTSCPPAPTPKAVP